MLMLLPLIFNGGGKFSVDALLKLLTARSGDQRSIGDLQACRHRLTGTNHCIHLLDSSDWLYLPGTGYFVLPDPTFYLIT